LVTITRRSFRLILCSTMSALQLSHGVISYLVWLLVDHKITAHSTATLSSVCSRIGVGIWMRTGICCKLITSWTLPGRLPLNPWEGRPCRHANRACLRPARIGPPAQIARGNGYCRRRHTGVVGNRFLLQVNSQVPHQTQFGFC
jgi:hypothetical protein